MTIDEATAATTTHGQTGPRTEAGKARSSRNSLKTGLYTAHDFIRDGEEEEYAETLHSLLSELSPENTLEQTFAIEIMGATWRLRRCRLVEAAFASLDDLDFDPMLDERTEKQQKSVDRARAQSHLILRRSLEELRQLRKGRSLQAKPASQTQPASHAEPPMAFPEPPPPPPDLNARIKALMAAADQKLANQYRESGVTSFCNPATAPAPVAKNIPRNAPCPCRSGAKYKKCCGGPAPQALKQAA